MGQINLREGRRREWRGKGERERVGGEGVERDPKVYA